MESFSEVGGAEDLRKVARRVRDADATFHSVQMGGRGAITRPVFVSLFGTPASSPSAFFSKKKTWGTNLPQLVNRGRGLQ